MIELLITCTLMSGSTFTIPEGWQVLKISSDSTWCYTPPCEHLYKVVTHVTLRRPVRVGDVVDIPNDCRLETRIREEAGTP